MIQIHLRDYGLAPGIYSPGPLNAITDVSGVRVGQFTLIEDENIRTGATAVLPHGGNLYQDRVPAGLAIGNGFGKFTGGSQLQELGELETPIILTNTLAVPRAAEAIVDWTLAQAGLEEVRSINPIVGEVNDGYLNDIRSRPLMVEHFLQAVETAEAGRRVVEGTTGAGTGAVCFGLKGGIGSSSRLLPKELGAYSIGVLVQANYGGHLQIMGVPVGEMLASDHKEPGSGDGSIMILVATDAPLSDRNLTRLAWRAFAGLARSGAAMSNGSGDYALAFSTASTVRRTPQRRSKVAQMTQLPNEMLSPFFQATIEATEEAIYNALFMATRMIGCRKRSVEALPVPQVLELLRNYRREGYWYNAC
jgi:D-aminopeptidase